MDELEIAPADVKARLDRGEKLFLVDVREPWEHQLCRIEGAKLVPLGSLAAKRAKSLAGGIERWSVEIDPKVPRY